jgi:hypothetical protein
MRFVQANDSVAAMWQSSVVVESAARLHARLSAQARRRGSATMPPSTEG